MPLWRMVDRVEVVARDGTVVRMHTRDMSTTCGGMVGVGTHRAALHAACSVSLHRIQHVEI